MALAANQYRFLSMCVGLAEADFNQQRQVLLAEAVFDLQKQFLTGRGSC